MAGLYVAASTMRRKGEDGEWDCLIGEGLFSNHGYQRGQTIANFIGDVIDSDTYDNLLAAEGQRRVACAHPLSEARAFYLDSYAYHGICKASYANSSTHCTVYPHSTLLAVANCYVSCSEHRNKMILKAKKAIPPHTELVWEYEESYTYPNHY